VYLQKIKLLTLIFILTLPLFSNAQLRVEIKTNKYSLYSAEADTISVCRDTVITFEALTIQGTDTLTDVHYYWDFDDKNLEDGLNLDSVEHSYPDGGGYRVRLTAETDTDTIWTIFPVQIAVRKNFSETKAEYNGDTEFENICLGSSAQLLGEVSSVIWRDQPIYKISESPPFQIKDSQSYSSSLFFDEFNMDSTYTGTQIDSISLTLSIQVLLG